MAELLSEPLERCQIALDRCDQNEEVARDYVLTHDWSEELFVRWGENLPPVNEDTMTEIVADFLVSGTVFQDPDFPPVDASLYLDPAVASWRCHDCNAANAWPSAATVARLHAQSPTREELGNFFSFIAQSNPSMALAMQANPNLALSMMSKQYGEVDDKLKCSSCTSEFPLRLLDCRPSQWLRPDAVRDEVSAQYGAGAPWVVIRDAVRPEDVRQGGVGNCWFLGALSILAHQHPEMVRTLFPLDTYPCGAHLVGLCKDGNWRNVVIDDLLPATRHGTLVYTSAARRQLWVPLIEKAAAKLFGCYEALQAGTLCEAFSLLTGCATDRLVDPDPDLLWAQLESAHAAKHLIGLACAASKSMTESALRDLGLQAPHAYVVLATRSWVSEAGRAVRLVHLGNPWGERSPSTWKGTWANNSVELAEAIRAGHLPAPLHEIVSNGEFWMDFDLNFSQCFPSIEVCRIDTHIAHTASGWLPALTGLGSAFEFETPASEHPIHADISLYQESHAVRGERRTNLDLGFVLSGMVVERKIQPEASGQFFLKPLTKYLLTPLCLGNALEHRKVVACIRCNAGVTVRTVSNNDEMLAKAIQAYCLSSVGKQIFPGLMYFVTKDDAGTIISVENQTTCMQMEVSVDADDSKNLHSSRGTLFTRDLVPPKSWQILMVLTPKQGAPNYSMSIAVAAARDIYAMEASHFPPIHAPNEHEDVPAIFGIHKSLPLEPARILSFKDLVKQTSDPSGASVIMRLLMKQEKERSRLYQVYLEAGISSDDAVSIAKEESETLYN